MVHVVCVQDVNLVVIVQLHVNSQRSGGMNESAVAADQDEPASDVNHC